MNDKSSDMVKVEFDFIPLVNFAMQQNRIPVIHQLSIENLTQSAIRNISIRLTAEPEFGNAVQVGIEHIPGESAVRIDALQLNLSPDYLAQLTERLAGNLILEVTSDSVSIFKQTYPIDVLAYDQWSGIGVSPEVLSAFITPNHAAVLPVIQKAARILDQWTENPSMDEYQSRNPDRVRKQMAAVYAAIAELNIIYSTIPASFEAQGQRIRLADSVMAQKLATCLDMALFYASCLEAIGIHPLIIIKQGHAFAGAWLVPETFPYCIIDDVSLLTKRAAEGIHDIVLVETTCMNMGNSADFDQAVKKANDQLSDTSAFVLAIDVCRSRLSGIRPIPQRVKNKESWEIREDPNLSVSAVLPAPQSIHAYDLSGIGTEITMTKQLLWERKLLDLSLRNNLLNIRITKNTLQLIPSDLSGLEDALAEGEEFQLLHKPVEWNNPRYEFGLYQSVPTSDPILQLINSELAQKRLHSYLSDSDLQKALTHLYRSSRTSIEENGANTLYLAIGLLKWYETPFSERPRYAPILLLPVEIIRKSASKGFVIRSREEEAMLNITLLEMLRQNFGVSVPGLDSLPTDESGVNVQLIYSIFRNSIKDQRKWDVEEQAILGIFSFNKFIMWNDIHNNSHKLERSKVVSSLINGKLEWEPNTDSVDATIIDKQLSPADLILPINADSSQLEAIYEAVDDQTFILHGPPGTGKSQTITNIIANALYRKKRVLFVAEKMAALSVVQNRLSAIGLAPFCLEIHSNKTKKSSVISQLKETTETLRRTPSEEFKKEADRLLTLRIELSKYIDALHKPYSFGISLYEAIVGYESSNLSPELPIPEASLDGLDTDTLKLWREAVEQTTRAIHVCGHPAQHPLAALSIHEYSSAIKEEIAARLSSTTDLLSAIQLKAVILAKVMGEVGLPLSRNDLGIATEIVNQLLHIPELTPTLLMTPRLQETLEEYEEIVRHGKERDTLIGEIEKEYDKKVLNLNAKEILAEWDKASEQWFLPRFLGQRRIKKTLARHAIGKLRTAHIKESLSLIVHYQEEAQHVSPHATDLATLFGKPGKREDWMAIEQTIRSTASIQSLLVRYAKELPKVHEMKQTLSRQLSEGIQPFREMYATPLNDLCQLSNQLTDLEKELSEVTGITLHTLYKEGTTEWHASAIARLSLWKDNLDKLKDWYQWLLACRKLQELKLEFIAEACREKELPADQLTGIFLKSFYQTAIRYIISREPVLELFNGKIFNDIIAKYKQMTADFESITRKELVARLSSNIPSFTQAAIQNSEVGILQKNIRNNARGISIRRLFDQIPTLLSHICPCMLMSPISVAQYIDPDADKFDLIIFDEASQMPTYEAIGAIARGKNVIIVGDPKQMPPTSFFSSSSVDEDNIEMEDLESILDDCLALSIPSKYLSWHYRSKHESLIAFSNSEYYDNKLLTFPSPDNIDSKVKLVRIKGFYDKGKSRQNATEAQAVVNEIARRLQDPQLREHSIGVVTFSIVQQSLIEDLLSDLFMLQPQLEALAVEREEPLFIKNLENVQGDERDVILFSIGYGPDATGRVSMNFGPLNREGGERRLNVAVSRARYEMTIYSTLTSDMIDLNRTSSTGVAGLKRFLKYAEDGHKCSFARPTATDTEATSVGNIIARRLRAAGHTTHTDIGCSGYKIDIGIVDPQCPSRYKLGIICDGKNYQRTKTMRDREVVQSSVLKALGWNICRVWTIDWWEKPEEVIDHIQKALVTPTPTLIAESQTATPAHTPCEALKAATFTSAPAHQLPNAQRVYTTTQLEPSQHCAEEFYDLKTNSLITSLIMKIIENESPVSHSLLCKKVLKQWGMSRLSQRASTYLNAVLDALPSYKTEHEGETFFWKNQEQYEGYSTYRPVSDRDATELPPEEIANAIKQILSDSVSLPAPDLLKACALLFGFPRIGSNIEASMQRGIQEAVKRGYAKIENQRVTFISVDGSK